MADTANTEVKAKRPRGEGGKPRPFYLAYEVGSDGKTINVVLATRNAEQLLSRIAGTDIQYVKSELK